MGDVAPGHRARDRGQLLLVTALALAVLLSVLTLALNTAVLGGVHVAGSDDSTREERAAVGFRSAVHHGVEGLLPSINARYVEYDALEAGLADEVGNWTALARAAYARDGVATAASPTGVAYETHIVQNASGDFTDQSGNASWTVAGSVANASGYDVIVSDDGDALVETANCTGGSGCFSLAVEGGDGNRWRMFVSDEDGDDDVDLAVETADGTTESCATSDQSVGMNVTDGTFDGGACTFTSFRDDPGLDPPYTLTYANANNVSGTYNLTVAGRIVDGTIGSDGSTGDGRYGTTGSPRLDPRIVAANVTVRYRSADLAYRTEIRVTPGETDG